MPHLVRELVSQYTINVVQIHKSYNHKHLEPAVCLVDEGHSDVVVVGAEHRDVASSLQIYKNCHFNKNMKRKMNFNIFYKHDQKKHKTSEG